MERGRSAVFGVLRGLLTALVPGLPIGLRHGRRYGLATFVTWALALIAFLALDRLGTTSPVVIHPLFFGVVQLQPNYLLFGLAAGLHIISVQEQVRPTLQDFLAAADAKSRWILTIAASLAIAAFFYYALYAPLLPR